MNKLDGLPSVHCITLKESVDRRQNLLKWFDQYSVPKYTINVFDRIVNLEHYIFQGQGSNNIPLSEKKLLISHFSVLRKWYETTNESSIVIFEDDVSLETVQYWNFTWEEFEKRLPNDCKCIQLSIIRYKCEPYIFDNREPYRRGHWSACAYFMKREYVKHLLDTYNPEPNLFLTSVPGVSISPELEQLLFLDIQRRVYVFPLFVEDCYKLKSTISDAKNEHRYSSHDCVINWWKEYGKNLTIDQIIK